MTQGKRWKCSVYLFLTDRTEIAEEHTDRMLFAVATIDSLYGNAALAE